METEKIELTENEIEMIRITREKERLAKEEIIAKLKIVYEQAHQKNLERIEKTKAKDTIQIAKANEFLTELGEGWVLKLETWTETLEVKGEYLDPDNKDGNYDREIIYSDTCDRQWASLVNGEYKVIVEEHIVDTSSRNSYRAHNENRGFKMRLTGPDIDYNQEKRFIAKPATILKNYNEAIERIENRKKRVKAAANAHDQAFSKFSTEFPTAEIEKGTEWESNHYERRAGGQSINIIRITFSNGIKVKYKIYNDGSMSRKELSFPRTVDTMSLLKSLNTMQFKAE